MNIIHLDINILKSYLIEKIRLTTQLINKLTTPIEYTLKRG